MSYRSVFRPGLFAGQTVVVTGSGSGIGRCTAHELAALGAHVVLVGRTAAKLEAVAAEIRRESGARRRFDGDTSVDIDAAAAVRWMHAMGAAELVDVIEAFRAE